MDLTDFDALSFDCYGTLIDWEAGMLGVLRPWADSHGVRLTDDELLAAYASQESQVEEDHPAWPYPEVMSRTFIGVGDALGVPVTPEDGQRLGSSVPDWPAFADSAKALQMLGSHFKLIILSNVDRASFAGSNARLGVTFDAILTAQDIGSYKPAAMNFKALLTEADRMSISQGKLLHVAQSLFHDHVPAKEAGLPTVWINRRSGSASWGATPAPSVDVKPDWEFSSMAEFAGAVEAANW
jgi:2-haloacid dehalogenase